MRRFDDDRYYRPTDPEMAVLGTPGTLAQWRHRGEGPPYVKHGARILYLGQHLNDHLNDHVIVPTAARGAKPQSTSNGTIADEEGDGS